ncbi:gamma-glutamyltransferase [Arthrobacter sp.]|uniref:gamma-glutamyltransferase family protein n=1 Tax=Arthrobacter sp. TaxID=1667 RepID=UPI002811506F|nr:gamma-glutamyltransferase [Arthrobacter sp.]
MTADNSLRRSGAIATPHRAATDIGVEIYAGGGNAVDAAIAASFALTVNYPHNTSIGGDLIALIRTPDNRIHCINASGPSAAATDAEILREKYGSKMPISGLETITVPGAVAGLEAIHRKAGRTRWEDLVHPAVKMANEGTVVTGSLGKAIAGNLSGIMQDEGMKSVFAPGGTPLEVGDHLMQPALARTLSRIASVGAGEMYKGEIGDALIRGLQKLGSLLAKEDLESYACVDAPVLSFSYDQYEIHTSGLNTQGFLLPQVLGACNALPEDRRDAGSLAILWAQANRDRDRLLADPFHSSTSEAEVLNEEYLQAMAHRALSREPIGVLDSFPQPKGDTVAVVAADKEGYAACIIQSVFHPFGSLILEPETGILLHNRGAFFSLDPSHANTIAPAKRPGHTLMPVMVTENGNLRWVLGTMGGKAQPQVHYQVLSRLMAGSTPAEAASRPRWIIGGLGADHPEDALYCEEDIPDSDKAALIAAGFKLTLVEPRSEFLGHANIVSVGSDQSFTATSDPRSDGTGMAV